MVWAQLGLQLVMHLVMLAPACGLNLIVGGLNSAAVVMYTLLFYYASVYAFCVDGNMLRPGPCRMHHLVLSTGLSVLLCSKWPHQRLESALYSVCKTVRRRRLGTDDSAKLPIPKLRHHQHRLKANMVG